MKTRTFRLNKLVRDKIVELTESFGGSVDYKILTDKELGQALVNKLIEEAEELKSSSLSVSELADLQDTINQLAKNLNITKTQIKRSQTKKRAENGGFSRGVFIKTLTVPANSQWADYYGSEPKRFPEITS